jgi:alcohol dehydrogenase
MQAVIFEAFGGPPRLAQVADPICPPDGSVIAVRATGLCRSDWHGWQGHDPDIRSLPHVPGHEFAGEIMEVGGDVVHWRAGDRVTMPFVAGCGTCPECAAGSPQVCDDQFQPGFTAWGSFAEAVAVRYADFNLVRVPPELDFVTAACFGCRLATAFRAVALQGKVREGDRVAIHGCGGVGLSAIMVAAALGAQTIAVDIHHDALALAAELGADICVNASECSDIAGAVYDATGRGADVSLDCLGSAQTAANSIRCLRKRGRHVQVGLLVGSEAQPRLPMELVIARELELRGSHGLAAADYGRLLSLTLTGKLDPRTTVRQLIALSQLPDALAEMGEFRVPGITVATI